MIVISLILECTVIFVYKDPVHPAGASLSSMPSPKNLIVIVCKPEDPSSASGTIRVFHRRLATKLHIPLTSLECSGSLSHVLCIRALQEAELTSVEPRSDRFSDLALTCAAQACPLIPQLLFGWRNARPET